MSDPIRCVTCKEPILRRADLVVAGKALVPLHHSCWQQPRGAWWRFGMGMPWTGLGFWVFMACLPALGYVVPRVLPRGDGSDLNLLLGFVGGTMLFVRGLVWATVERKVDPR